MWETDIELIPIRSPLFVWISHEHPDHFSTQTLRQLLELSPRVVFLYHETSDMRVVSWLRMRGVAVKELKNGEVESIVPGLKLLCRRVGTGDSYLIANCESTTFVNTNDSILFDHEIKTLVRDCKKFGQIDYLTCQFGLAGKVGNEADDGIRRVESSKVHDLVIAQILALNARHFHPSASMKIFSKPDNAYMNRGQIPLRELLARVQSETQCTPIFLPLLETWRGSKDSFTLNDFVEAYDAKLKDAALSISATGQNGIQSRNAIQQTVVEWWKRQTDYHSGLALKLIFLVTTKKFHPQLTFYLCDQEARVFIGKLEERYLNVDTSEIKISDSNALLRAASEDFGMMSLVISARFQADGSAHRTLRVLGWVGAQRSASNRITLTYLIKMCMRASSFVLHRRKSL